MSVAAAATREQPLDGARTVLLVGVAGLLLERALAMGAIRSPIELGITYLSPGVLLGYLVIPLATLAALGYHPITYFRLGRWRSVLPLFGLSVAGVLGGVLWLAVQAPLRAYYGTTTLTAGALLGLLLTLACNEFFFRGFLLLPLASRLGWYALPIGVLPYCLLHLGKPTPELYGSLPFALLLGYLALRSGSILYGVVLHWLLAAGLPFWIALAAR